MKRVITGLAAIIVGCATAAAPETPADFSGKPFVTKVKPVEFRLPEAPIPFYSEDMPLPSETFSYDTANRAEREETVVMNPHGYTIKSGRMLFTHFERQPVRDIHDNIILGWTCENRLIIRNAISMQIWTDEGCSGHVESYEELDENGMPFAAEYPASNSWAMSYDSTFDILLAEEVDMLWRARWNIPERPPASKTD